jgi:Replication initiator protein, pSAM2
VPGLLRLRGSRALAVARSGVWRRFSITLGRTLARVVGVCRKELKGLAKVNYTKVAEFQARGMIHVHAVMRLDGPDGPDSSPRIGLDAVELGTVIEDAARAVRLEVHPAGLRAGRSAVG